MRRKIITLLLCMVLVLGTMPVQASLPPNYADFMDTPWQTYFKNINTNMDELSGVHPRIWLDNDDFNRIRGYAQNEYKQLWSLVQKTADNHIGKQEPFKEVGENVWMNDQGRNLVNLIFTYKISGDPKYLEAATAYVDTICEYPSWANKATADNAHLAGSSSYLAFGLYYDWCYNDISPEQRKKVVDNIARRVEDFNIDWAHGWDNINPQNMIVNNTGAFIALSAMYEEIPRAEEYMKRTAAKIATLVMEVMPDDGESFESVHYSSLAWIGILQFGMAARDILNVDIFKHPTFDAYARTLCYSYIPSGGWNTGSDVFGWADGTTASTGKLLPVMSFMAREKQNPVYQYFVQKRLETFYEQGAINQLYMYPLMFADPNLEAKSPAEYVNTPNSKLYYPLDYITSDCGYVFLRDGWDGNEAAMHFHCGPIIGHTAADYRKVYKGNTLGIGHAHPDMGGLLLFAEGEWQFNDDGYTTPATSNHNTLTINGEGQLNDPVYNKVQTSLYGFTGWQAGTFAKPFIEKQEIFGDMTYVACNLTNIYPDYHYGAKDVKLEKYVRHYVYLKPEKTLFVVDEIKTTFESDFEIRWFPYSQSAVLQPDGSYLYSGKNSSMRLETFAQDGVTVENSVINKLYGKAGAFVDALTMQIRKTGKEWTQATAISWENYQKGEPVNTSLKEENGIYYFSTNDGIIMLDPKNQTVEKKKSESEINIKVDDVLLFSKDGILSVNDRTYLPLKDCMEVLNLSLEGNVIKKGDIQLELSKLENPLYENNGVSYVPLRELCDKFQIALRWDGNASCVYINTKADVNSAELFALSVSGTVLQPNEDGNYEIELFTDKVKIDVTPKVDGAKVEIDQPIEGFGESKVRVTSLDGKNSKEFTVTVHPKSNMGSLPVYNVISDYGTKVEFDTLFDGDFETAWAVEGAGIPAVFDLGSSVDLHTVSIAFLHGAKRQQIIQIAVSEDNENYTEIFNGKASGKTKEMEKYSVNQKARYVRIVFDGHTNGGGWNNTSEIAFD